MSKTKRKIFNPKLVKHTRHSLKDQNLVAEPAVAYQLQLRLQEQEEKIYSVSKLDIEHKLEELLKQNLTFKGQKTSYATRNLHSFAAKFPPQLPRLFIKELTKPKEWVLDPMAGSGTTLVEAILSGRNVTGVDLDPLAVLIAQVKTKPLDLPSSAKIGAEVLNKAKNYFQKGSFKELERFYPSETIKFFEYWFEKKIILELCALVRTIQTVDDEDVRALLQVIFSSTIITKNGGVSQARDLAHSRPHKDPIKKAKRSAFEVFKERLFKAIEWECFKVS